MHTLTRAQVVEKYGAVEVNRTLDLLITNHINDAQNSRDKIVFYYGTMQIAA